MTDLLGRWQMYAKRGIGSRTGRPRLSRAQIVAAYDCSDHTRSGLAHALNIPEGTLYESMVRAGVTMALLYDEQFERRHA